MEKVKTPDLSVQEIKDGFLISSGSDVTASLESDAGSSKYRDKWNYVLNFKQNKFNAWK